MCGQIVVKPTMSPSGPTPPCTRLPSLSRTPGASGSGIGDVHRLVGLEVLDVGEPVGGIGHPGRRHRGPGFRRGQDGIGGRAGGNHAGAGQEPTAADVDEQIAAFHGFPPRCSSAWRSQAMAVPASQPMTNPAEPPQARSRDCRLHPDFRTSRRSMSGNPDIDASDRSRQRTVVGRPVPSVQPGAMPLSVSSWTAFPFFARWASPIPRST